MGNLQSNINFEIEMIELRRKNNIGRCGLCLTSNIPMENDLFCIYCYDFYMKD